MNTDVIFMVGEAVSYTGEKFRTKLHGKKGWLHAPVINQPDVWVVEFPDTKNSKDQNDTDDYILPVSVLSKWRLSKEEIKQAEGPEIQPRRSKKRVEEES